MNLAAHTMKSYAPSPCGSPVIAQFLGPLCESTGTASVEVRPAEFPSLVDIQHGVLGDLMTRSMAGDGFSLNVKYAELAIRDLVVLVQASNLTAKASLADALLNFAIDARTSGRRLQKLSGQVDGIYDRYDTLPLRSALCLLCLHSSMTSFNAYALRTIGASQQQSPLQVDRAVVRAFHAAMDEFSSQITRVIVQATNTMAALDELEARLHAIHGLCVHEELATTVALEDLLWELWTVLGGNKSQVRDLRQRERVLREVERYRAVAMGYVSATTQTLQAVEGALSELRDRLSNYGTGSQLIPLEAHIAGIEHSIARLRNRGEYGGMAKAEGRALIGA